MKFDNYIGKFASSGDVQTALNDGDLIKPYIALVEGEGIDYNSKTETDYRTIPLTFEILSDGNIVWKHDSSDGIKTIEYSLNGGNWTSITSSEGGAVINVNSGDTVQFRGNNEYYSYKEDDVDYYNTFSGSTAQFKVYGNIMSLINRTNFSGLTTFNRERVFLGLFICCTGLTDASKLVLPATALTESCYASMFYNCTSLTTAPALPATTLADSCYRGMFNSCYSLNYIKCLATDISASSCTTYWVVYVASSGTFVKNPNINNWPTGTSGIPSTWTVVDAS